MDVNNNKSPIPRFTTNVPGLDALLGGGLYEGSTYLIEGMPGAGKTLLANQIGFGLAERGKNTIYLTLLAESHAKLINHLRPMRFFNESRVGRELLFLSGYQELHRGGHAGLLELIAAMARAHRPYLLVVDGFRQARETPDLDAEVLTFVHGLNALALAMRCAVLLLAPYERLAARPEQALVDGLIELSRSNVIMRTVREIEVHKLRAAEHLYGRHFFAITAEGITVYPRLEATIRSGVEIREGSRRLCFGVPKLDAMIDGGLVAGSATSLVGSPGCGKTILGLSFLLEGARKREPSLYFGFYEAPARLRAKMKGIGLPLDPAIESGMLSLVWQPPVERLLDALAWQLLGAIERRNVRRVVIDGIEGLRTAAIYTERMVEFLAALTNLLRARGTTLVLTQELPIFSEQIESPIVGLSAVVENLILMRQVELRARLYRLISIIKLRESGYDPSIHEFTISARGIDVSTTFSSAEAILTGHPRTSTAAAPRPKGRSRAASRRR